MFVKRQERDIAGRHLGRHGQVGGGGFGCDTFYGVNYDVYVGNPDGQRVQNITYADGTTKTIQIKSRIDTEVEIEYLENGGVLHYVLRNLAKA